MSDAVLYETDGSIGKITLNRPENSNRINVKMQRQVIKAFEKSKSNKDLVVIYRAEGQNFTHGADLQEAVEFLSNHSLHVEDSWNWQEITRIMLSHPGIIIVGYHGWVVGGGFEHTLGSDFRIAAQGTKIMLPELKHGIFFSNASTKILPRLIGEAKAKEIMLLGDVISAEYALQIGLVHSICPIEELDVNLMKLAQKIVEKAPHAISLAKEMINEGWDRSIDDVLLKECDAVIKTAMHEETFKRISKFLQK